ncbi:hypothetical protein D3C87_1269060 [compost metagenome]
MPAPTAAAPTTPKAAPTGPRRPANAWAAAPGDANAALTPLENESALAAISLNFEFPCFWALLISSMYCCDDAVNKK